MSKAKNFLINLIVVTAITLLFLVLDHYNDYMTEKPYHLTVTNMYSGESGGKHNSLKFIVVYKTENEVYFDNYVSASEYSRTHVGDTVIKNFRPFDVVQTTKDNIIWFFLVAVLLTSVLIAGWIVTFAHLIAIFTTKD